MFSFFVISLTKVIHSISLVLSKFDVNSSRRSKFGLFTNACAKNTRCFSPPERVPIDLFWSFREFVNSNASLMLAFSFLLSHGRNPFWIGSDTKSVADRGSSSSICLNWGTYPRVGFSPTSVIWLVLFNFSRILFNNVVLPTPFFPTTATTFPEFTENVMLSNIVLSPIE